MAERHLEPELEEVIDELIDPEQKLPDGGRDWNGHDGVPVPTSWISLLGSAAAGHDEPG